MGIGWSTDYPYAGVNLMIRLSELTKAPVAKDENGDPPYWVVRLTDDTLFRCPIVMGSDVGTIGLSDQEALRLRQYLLKGGFLWVDDFWVRRRGISGRTRSTKRCPIHRSSISPSSIRCGTCSSR